jgi:hypothetical protein
MTYAQAKNDHIETLKALEWDVETHEVDGKQVISATKNDGSRPLNHCIFFHARRVGYGYVTAYHWNPSKLRLNEKKEKRDVRALNTQDLIETANARSW